MMSTTDLLACHHDAKLPPAGISRDRLEQPGPAGGRLAAFRPGLRVTIGAGAGGAGAGEERPGVARWTRAGGAEVTPADRV